MRGEEWLQKMPVLFPDMVLLVMVGEEDLQQQMPSWSFSVMVLLVMDGEEESLQ